MQHKLHKTLKTALLEKGENINLYGCNLCGFVFNQSFDPKKTKYSENLFLKSTALYILETS